jgi:hypothetical protein
MLILGWPRITEMKRLKKARFSLKSALFDQLGKWHDVLGVCRAGLAK